MAMNKKLRWIVSSLTLLAMTTVYAHEWKKIDDGLSYAKIGTTHVFRIDPQLYRFSVATASENGLINTTAQELALRSKAILAINGGFFSLEQKSIGLLMRDGKIINPLHSTHWWAVFYLLDQKPRIVLPYAFRKDPKMEMALQVGPRLLVDGKKLKVKPSLAHRSGIGIKEDGTIFIAATQKEMSMEEFTQLFLELDCENALNLDGGGSTQLYFRHKGFKLDIEGPSLITNAITVFPRY